MRGPTFLQMGTRFHAASSSRVAAAVLLAAATLNAAACSGGREARLAEVERRSRAAPETITALERPFLEDSEPDVRALAVWAIGAARAPEAVEVLSPLAKDKSAWVRLSVVLALCPVSAETAPEAVVPLAMDPDPETRRAAVRCIAAKSHPAQGVLAAAVRDNDKDVRAAALEGLARHPEASARDALVAAVTSHGMEEQLAAVAALRALRDPGAVPDLEKAAALRLPAPVRDAVEAAIIDLRKAGEETTSEAPAAPSKPALAPHGKTAKPQAVKKSPQDDAATSTEPPKKEP